MIGRRVRAKVSVIPYIWLTYGSAAIYSRQQSCQNLAATQFRRETASDQDRVGSGEPAIVDLGHAVNQVGRLAAALGQLSGADLGRGHELQRLPQGRARQHPQGGVRVEGRGQTLHAHPDSLLLFAENCNWQPATMRPGPGL